ncbi:hypothetical protein VNO77_21702 [Canavalia gladiata]|uniref:Uncharacterized protein n=1 Tax=Canavalia gladiata TaxID=3824 RepID=A0AAN9QDU9_CANGL
MRTNQRMLKSNSLVTTMWPPKASTSEGTFLKHFLYKGLGHLKQIVDRGNDLFICQKPPILASCCILDLPLHVESYCLISRFTCGDGFLNLLPLHA